MFNSPTDQLLFRPAFILVQVTSSQKIKNGHFLHHRFPFWKYSVHFIPYLSYPVCLYCTCLTNNEFCSTRYLFFVNVKMTLIIYRRVSSYWIKIVKLVLWWILSRLFLLYSWKFFCVVLIIPFPFISIKCSIISPYLLIHNIFLSDKFYLDYFCCNLGNSFA